MAGTAVAVPRHRGHGGRHFGVGAIWFDGRDSAQTGARITVTDTDTDDHERPYEAFPFIDGSGAGRPIRNVTTDGARVAGVGTFVVGSQTQARSRSGT